MLFAITLLMTQVALAQSVDTKVNKIREKYNAAQETAKWKNTEGWMEHGCYSFDFNSRINYAAAGVIETNTEVFITVSDEYDSDDRTPFRRRDGRPDILLSALQGRKR